jgi:CheY-like chemotaxis protein
VEGDEACLSVEDTGAGMSDAVRERAFEPFFTTKGAAGTGLGLAEVYGIARRHRGTVTIESEPQVGTKVTLRLAAATGALSAQSSLPRSLTETTGRCRVLIVEDHEDGREFLRRMLESNGHSVTAVGSCHDARQALAIGGDGRYDLLLTDVGLPDGSGWELVPFARAHVPSIRVGVITGWEPMVSADDAVSVEFVLRKPLRAAELLAHISGAGSPAPTE